jgi:hypothetical protein
LISPPTNKRFTARNVVNGQFLATSSAVPAVAS